MIAAYAHSLTVAARWMYVSKDFAVGCRRAPAYSTDIVWPPEDVTPPVHFLQHILTAPGQDAGRSLHLELHYAGEFELAASAYLAEVLSVVRPFTHRLVSFAFVNETRHLLAVPTLVDHLIFPAPRLERFSILNRLSHAAEPRFMLQLEPIFARSAPLLRWLSLQLDGIPLYRVPAFDAVSTLTLSFYRFDGPEDVDDVRLAGCSSVRHLILRSCSSTMLDTVQEEPNLTEAVAALQSLDIFTESVEDSVEVLQGMAHNSIRSIQAHSKREHDGPATFPHGFVSAVVGTLDQLTTSPLNLKLVTGSATPGCHAFVFSVHGATGQQQPTRTFVVEELIPRPEGSLHCLVKQLTAAGVCLSRLRSLEVAMSGLPLLASLSSEPNQFVELEALTVFVDARPYPQHRPVSKWPGKTLRKVVFRIRQEQLFNFTDHGGQERAMTLLSLYVDLPSALTCTFGPEVR